MADFDEIMRVVLTYALPTASEVLNIFLFKLVDNPGSDEDTLDDFVDWTTNVWGPDWADLAASAASIIQVAVDVVNLDGTVARNIGSESLAIPGTVGGEIGVAAAAAYIKADTALPKTRGSKYIPGLGEGNIADGLLTVESLGDLALLIIDFFTVYLGAVSTARYEPGVVSRPTETWVPFEGNGYITDVPAYQRRRKPNVGS